MMFSLAFRNLLRNPRRSVTLLLTVASGTAALFLFLGFNHGIMNQYKDNTIRSRYGHGQINTKGYREKVYEKPWEHWISSANKLMSGLEKHPAVQFVFPRVEFFALLTNGRITVAGRGQGVLGRNESRFFTTLNVEEGENLSTQDDGILLGRGLARALDVKPGDRVTVLGNTVHGSMNGGDFTVSGIFHTGTKEFDDSIFRIQLEQAQTLLDTKRIESIALGLTSETAWPQVVSWVEEWNGRALLTNEAERVNTSTMQESKQVLNQKSNQAGDQVLDQQADQVGGQEIEATPFAVLDKIYYQHSVDWLNQQFAVIQLIILSLVVLGIFNTVSSSILERRPEIGNLRANGESSKDVVSLLLLEGAIVGVSGALAGALFAFLLNETVLSGGILMPPAPGLTRQFHVKIEFLLSQAVWAVMINGLSAVTGTALAAWRTVKMPIAEALRAS